MSNCQFKAVPFDEGDWIVVVTVAGKEKVFGPCISKEKAVYVAKWIQESFPELLRVTGLKSPDGEKA
jgi:hypothetical protein